MEETDVSKALGKLGTKIADVTLESLKRGRLKPEQWRCLRMKPTRFEYGESGVNYSGEGEYETTKTWHRATRTLTKQLKNSSEHLSASEILVQAFADADKARTALERFTARLVSDLLRQGSIDQKRQEALITTLVKEVQGQPLSYGARVELDGIVVLSPPIRFTVGETDISIRATSAQDLERETPVDVPAIGLPRVPSAVIGRRGSARYPP